MNDEVFPLLDNGTVSLTEHGLLIHRPLTIEEWRRHLRSLRTVKHAYLHALADLARHGRQQFGDAVVNQEMEQMEFDMQDALKAESIGLLPLDLRTEFQLTAEQAYILATTLDDEADRRKWAAICLSEKLTGFELKRSIQAGRILRQDEIATGAGQSAGIPTIHGVRFQFEKWRRAIGGEDTLLTRPDAEKIKLLELLTPFVELAAKLEASIPQN